MIEMVPSEETYHIGRAKKGNPDSFARLVGTYQDRIYTLCLRMLAVEEDAADAAQETFIKAYHSLPGFELRSRFSTWLFRIAYNHCISVIRKKVKVIDLVGEVPDEEPDTSDISGLDLLRSEERHRLVQMALESLPETDAVVTTLFYLEELTLQEIAGVTGLTSGNIRIKLHRSRKKMYQVLAQHLKDEIKSIA